MSIVSRRFQRAVETVYSDPMTVTAYDARVLQDAPVAYWPLNYTDAGVDLVDRTGYPRAVTAYNTPTGGVMPSGEDTCAVFNGSSQFIEVSDSDNLSVATTGILTIEAWLRPDTLEFSHSEDTGYVHWLGKGTPGQQEYVARIYSLTNSEQRPNRVSGYAFKPTGGLGTGSYEQDAVDVGEWIHYVLVINTVNTSASYTTGYTKLYKNGVLRDQDALSDYGVIPTNGTAPLRIGTRDLASYFQGAIAKVAVYDYEPTAPQLLTHYREMVSPGTIVNVSTAAQLTAALSSAQPGQTIVLADGSYSGQFAIANKTATAVQPITIEGSKNAIISGGSTSSGYAFYVNTCRYVTLRGFQITGAQKSLVLDGSVNCTIDRLTTHDCGSESILVRKFSTDNTIKNCTVYNTGLVTAGYGEGIYIGQYYGNWMNTSSPDKSDRNRILNNTISFTAAECIDIKEGTSSGLIRANILDGTYMSGANYADSWIDIAGNSYSVTHNIGTNKTGDAGATLKLLDGIQTHTQPYPASTASNNLFMNNTCGVNASGYGINIDDAGNGNIVQASNVAVGAASGLTNIAVT